VSSAARHFHRCHPPYGVFGCVTWFAKGGFYHDGRYPTLRAVVDHYDSCFKLGLSSQEKTDLVQYLRGR
jgi:hypothetical protein